MMSARGGRRQRPLLELLRGLLWAALAPAIVIASPLVRVLAWDRRRALRRLGTFARHDDGLQRGSAALHGRGPVQPPEFNALPASHRNLVEPDVVVVGADFAPSVYADTFDALQLAPRSKLLDLRPAQFIDSDLFEALAQAWSVPAGTVPRIGILLSFDRWVLLRSAANSSLQRLAVKGVAAELFYEEQAGAHLGRWFSHGEVSHNVAGVLDSLLRRWQPSPAWPVILDGVSSLLRQRPVPDDIGRLLARAAQLALSCNSTSQALALAREALTRLPSTPSRLRCSVLRIAGVALIGQGQPAIGSLMLDDAIVMATTLGDLGGAASLLCERGGGALARDDYRDAEKVFRCGIVLLAATHEPELLATLHHNLAVALDQQGAEADAELHVTTALQLRADKRSPRAEEHRRLLTHIRGRNN